LKDNLEAEGYKVDMALNGEEALEHIRNNRPNLILLDLLMPKQDGFYVLEKVRKNPEWKLIPIIVLSNLGGDLEIKRALELGADDYFVKSQHPIEEVIEKVKEYLEGKKPVRPLTAKKPISESIIEQPALAEEKRRAEAVLIAEEKRKMEAALMKEKERAEAALVEEKRRAEATLIAEEKEKPRPS